MGRLSFVPIAVAACCVLGGCGDDHDLEASGLGDAAANDGFRASGEPETGADSGRGHDAGMDAHVENPTHAGSGDGGGDTSSPDAGADGGDPDAEGGSEDGSVDTDGGTEQQELAPPCEVQAGSVSAVLGPAGGEIVGPDCVTVGLREETLAASREVVVRRAEDVEPPARFQTVGPVYELLPGGERFAIPVEVTIPFELEEIPPFLTTSAHASASTSVAPIRNLVVLYAKDGSKWVELPGTSVGQALRVELWQLGWVAIGTRRAGACTFTVERHDQSRTHVTNEQGLLVSLHQEWSFDRNIAGTLDEYSEFEYDDLNRLSTATTWQMVFGEIGDVTGFPMTESTATYVHSYSSRGDAEVEVIKEVGADESTTYTRTYNDDGNLVRTDQEWSDRDYVLSTRHTYSAGVLVKTEDFVSDQAPQTLVTYDTDGRVLSRVGLASFDTLLQLHESYTYDDNGYLLRQRQQLTDPDGQPLDSSTTISDVRNAAGQLLMRETVTRARGSVTLQKGETFEYDADGYLTKRTRRTEDSSGTVGEYSISYTRDAAGHAIVEERTPMVNGWKTTRTYEGDLLMLEEQFSDADGDGAYDWNSTITHAYADGLEISRVEEVDTDGDGTVDERNPQTATYEGVCDFASYLFDALWRPLPRNFSGATQ